MRADEPAIAAPPGGRHRFLRELAWLLNLGNPISGRWTLTSQMGSTSRRSRSARSPGATTCATARFPGLES